MMRFEITPVDEIRLRGLGVQAPETSEREWLESRWPKDLPKQPAESRSWLWQRTALCCVGVVTLVFFWIWLAHRIIP